MPSIADTDVQLRSVDRPVLFLDTCILLDVIRAPQRSLKDCVKQATRLRALLTVTPSACSLVIASVVENEWSNHATNTRDELRKHLLKLQEQTEQFHEACNALGISLGYGPPAYAVADLHTHLFDLSKDILSRGFRLDRDGECSARAVDRVNANLPPSRQGGQMKDCVIVEECLELARRLRANGFVRKCVFCTSNTKDFGTPHTELATDFASVNLYFTTNLPWAIHVLTT